DMELVASGPRAAGSSVMLNVFVNDVDGALRDAIGNGAREIIAPHDAFWGDRYAEFQDSFGHRWAISHRLQQLPAEEQDARAHQFPAKHGEIRIAAAVVNGPDGST